MSGWWTGCSLQPRYGEKWGRHWLDVTRYADSTDADEDYRQLGDDGFQLRLFRIVDIGLPALQSGFPTDQKSISPVGDGCRCDPVSAAKSLQILPPQKVEYDRNFTPRR